MTKGHASPGRGLLASLTWTRSTLIISLKNRKYLEYVTADKHRKHHIHMTPNELFFSCVIKYREVHFRQLGVHGHFRYSSSVMHSTTYAQAGARSALAALQSCKLKKLQHTVHTYQLQTCFLCGVMLLLQASSGPDKKEKNFKMQQATLTEGKLPF